MRVLQSLPLALALVAGAVALPPGASAQTDPKAAAAAAKAAAERAKAEAQAANAASGPLRLRGRNGAIDVVRPSTDAVDSTQDVALIYTVFGVKPSIDFQFSLALGPRSASGFYEVPSQSGPTNTAGLSIDQRNDMMEAARSGPVMRTVAAGAGSNLATFVRREIRFRPPPSNVKAQDGFATLTVTAHDGSGATRQLTLRVDVVPRHGTLVDNFNVNGGFSLENAYLALSLASLADKRNERGKPLFAMGFDTLGAYESLGGAHSDGFIISNDNAVFVVFRGTDPFDVLSVLGDATFHPIAATGYAASRNAQVHSGFANRFEQDFEARVVDRLTHRDAGKQIILIGHSLGAALATVAAARLNTRHLPVKAVYAFASPNVGNMEFKADYNSRLGQVHYRMINQEDPVPRLPPGPVYWAVGRLWYIDHKPGHTIRDMEFDDLDPDMVAYCTLHCGITVDPIALKASASIARHDLEKEYWKYVAQNLPASVDRSKLPPMPR